MAEVLFVKDGDTVDVKWAGMDVTVRLDGIDCPESQQASGQESTWALIRMIGNKSVELELHGVDDYGRLIATVYVSMGRTSVNVNEHLVENGLAWVYDDYLSHLPEDRQDHLKYLEEIAKSYRRGLWKSTGPTPPSEWRRLRLRGNGTA